MPSTQRKSRLLAIATRPWSELKPFLRAFEHAGFAVALVQGAAGGQILHDASIALFPARPAQFGGAIQQAIADLSPDLVIAADAASFQHLATLYRSRGEPGRLGPALARSIARSLGGLAVHDRFATPAALYRFARANGLPAPASTAEASRLRAGGVAASRAIACRDGEVLAGVTVTFGAAAGPAKIVRHPPLDAIAAIAVERLRLSGLIGLDFVLEPDTRQPWLTAINPFAAPRLPLAAPGAIGLPDALYAAFAGGSDTAPGAPWRAAS